MIVRELEGDLQVVFWDKYSIYASCHGARYVFHRWYAPLGSYNAWRQFRHLLLRRRNLTMRDIFELAESHGVLFKCAVGRLQWGRKPVEIRLGHIRIIGVSDDMQDVLRE